MGERPSELEQDEQLREILLHGAAGQAVTAVVLHAGFEGARVTERFSEVFIDRLAHRLVQDWGKPRPVADQDALLEAAMPVDEFPEAPDPRLAEGLTLGLIRSEVMSILASGVAANYYRRSIDRSPSAPDFADEVTELLELMDGTEEQRLQTLEQWRIDTDNLLQEYWSGVEHVADALRTGELIDEDVVRGLVGPIEGEIDSDDELGQATDLTAVQLEAAKRIAHRVARAQAEEDRAAQRVSELISGEELTPEALAEAMVELQQARRELEATHDFVDMAPRNARLEVWRIVEGETDREPDT